MISGPVETNAHLLRYDSVHGRFPGDGDGGWRHDRRRPRPDPCQRRARPGQAAMGSEVDIALECTGIFTSKDKAEPPSAERLEARPRLGPRLWRRQDGRLRRQPRER